ncbi:MAG: hypothetical protein F7B60_04880 [Desulfurococcales archaeon]|nr:hypothetical protein [Desulfurococcales archaeon]
MGALNFPEITSLAALLLLLMIIVYVLLNYRESSRILRKYSEAIKMTMNIEEVKQFISSHKGIRVQVEEINNIVEIYWVAHSKYPYMFIEFDRSRNKITGVFLIETKEDEMKARSDGT